LQRVVVDEVHQFLTSHHYRPFLIEQVQKRTLPYPFLFLSATIPPAMELDLKATLRNPSLVTVREATVRTNIGYMVKICRNEEEMKRELLDQIITVTEPQDRAIIYVLAVDDIGTVEEELMWVTTGMTWARYYADMEEPLKESNYQKWITGEAVIMIATTAFGEGVHYDAVNLVIHWKGAHNLVAFIQNSGRAGRNGTPSKSVTITTAPLIHQLTRDSNDIVSYLTTPGCKRQHLFRYADGIVPKNCISGGGVACDTCATQLRKRSFGREFQKITIFKSSFFF
jgi:superfamily II DNA helicase RecQ